MKRISTLAITVLLLLSAVVGVVPASALAGTPSGPPGGMVAVDAANIHINGQTASSLQNTETYRVYASDHADAMTISYSVAFAQNNNANACDTSAVGSNPNCEVSGLTINLTDNQNHEGREIAIPKTVVDEATGGNPGAVTVQHSSGDTYKQAVETHGNYYVFKIEEFSTNTVEFDGTTTLDGTATNGSTLTYDIADTSSVSNFTIDVTGAPNTETDTETASRLHGGESMGLSIASDTEPTGETTTEPQVSVKGVSGNESDYTGSENSETLVGYDSNNGDIEVQSSPEKITGAWIYVASGDANVIVDVWVSEEGADSTAAEGTQVKESYTMPESTGWHYIDFGQTITTSSGSTSTTIGFNSQSTTDQYNNTAIYHDGSGSGQLNTENGVYGTPAVKLQSKPTSVTINSDTGQTASVGDLSLGETSTHSMDLSSDTSQLSVDATGGAVDLAVTYNETTQTTDPTVVVNGNVTDYTGTLADGETVSLTTNTDWITEGENTVDIKVGDGTSEDAPAPQVGLNYTHDTRDDQTVSYDANKWTEEYNVSKTYGADTESASLTIPFEGNVLQVSEVEIRENGGEWSSVPESEYSFNETELTVQLGDQQAGDTVDVRATGQKIVSVNSEVTVIEPSGMGETLDSKIRLDSWSSDSYLSLGGTPQGHLIHETYNESWSNPSVYTEITGADYNRLHAPNAADGSTTRVTATDIGVTTSSNEVLVEMVDSSMPITAELRTGEWNGDNAEITYYNAQSDKEYILESVTDDVVLDDATASDGTVTLSATDTDGEIKLSLDDGAATSGDGSSSSSSGPVVIDPSTATDSSLLNSPVVLMGVGVALLVALYYIQARLFDGLGESVAGIPTSGVFIAGAGIVAFVIVDMLSGNTLSTSIAEGIGTVTPMLSILTGLLVIYYAYKRWIKGQDTTIQVIGRRRGGK